MKIDEIINTLINIDKSIIYNYYLILPIVGSELKIPK